MGVPGSKGCIRLRNQDIIELFERVKIGENVVIMQP
jgi:lipoprotein-anchoring transpeptidase ErfK/SrfK